MIEVQEVGQKPQENKNPTLTGIVIGVVGIVALAGITWGTIVFFTSGGVSYVGVGISALGLAALWYLVLEIFISSLFYEWRVEIAALPRGAMEAPLKVSHTVTDDGRMKFSWKVPIQYVGWQVVVLRAHREWPDFESQKAIDEYRNPNAENREAQTTRLVIYESGNNSGEFTDEPPTGTFPEYEFHLEKKRPRVLIEVLGIVRNPDLKHHTGELKITQHIHEATWATRADEMGDIKTYTERVRDTKDVAYDIMDAEHKRLQRPPEPPRAKTPEELREDMAVLIERFAEEEVWIRERAVSGNWPDDDLADALAQHNQRKNEAFALRQKKSPRVVDFKSAQK